ncbi:hypothetical protein P0D75_43930 [Paraburkholderia sediminicola]|uniref:hypothetical protein n=1 Tax=Paraburkholderia sediminicola TaxID=458836 RepID=UPI00105E283D
MENLVYERIDDARVAYPYLFVYLLRDGEVFKMGLYHPFLQIAVGNDREPAFTFYPTEEPVSLNVEHWQHILETARDFLPEALASGD